MTVMNEISRFFGIAIAMFYQDGHVPRFDAFAAEHHVQIDIDSGTVTGPFPPRALGLVLEWRARHLAELRANWDLARLSGRLRAIAPLE
jgi:hypothetical protein